jgi:hypothetical protein
MEKRTDEARREDSARDDEDLARRALDENPDDRSTRSFNPRTGEDPGLLELTEDPRERRQKRNTM